jgi:hypothetical protein
MNTRNMLKETIVLLIATVMIFSSGGVVATTNNQKVTPGTVDASFENSRRSSGNEDLVWDNVVGVHGSLGGVIAAQDDGAGYNATPADDFMFSTVQHVNSVFWQGGYFACETAHGMKDYNWDWRITFWADRGDGNAPGSGLYQWMFPNATIQRRFWYNYTRPDNGRQYWVANYTVQLPENVLFEANTKYWISIQGLGEIPQSCWSRHNESVGGILLHQAVYKCAYSGYPDWVNLSVIFPDHLPHDLNYQLLCWDYTPPVTTCILDGEMQGDVYVGNVIVTLNATDDLSGVNWTKCKLDAGAWTLYTAPFVVTTEGAHNLYFYSADNSENTETQKNCTFTIQYYNIISIAGLIGITVIVKNIAKENKINVNWSINLTGGIILVGKSAGGKIIINANKTVTVKDKLILGFGKTTITVKIGGYEKKYSALVLLLFVLGVKPL